MVPSSLTWRSAIAATRSVSLFSSCFDWFAGESIIAPLAFATHIGKAPFFHVDLVVDAREHTPATDLHLRRGQFALSREAFGELIHKPGRNGVALSWINPAKIQKMHEQDFPMRLQIAEKPVPIDIITRLQDDMSNVRAIIAMALLDE